MVLHARGPSAACPAATAHRPPPARPPPLPAHPAASLPRDARRRRAPHPLHTLLLLVSGRTCISDHLTDAIQQARTPTCASHAHAQDARPARASAHAHATSGAMVGAIKSMARHQARTCIPDHLTDAVQQARTPTCALHAHAQDARPARASAHAHATSRAIVRAIKSMARHQARQAPQGRTRDTDTRIAGTQPSAHATARIGAATPITHLALAPLLMTLIVQVTHNRQTAMPERLAQGPKPRFGPPMSRAMFPPVPHAGRHAFPSVTHPCQRQMHASVPKGLAHMTSEHVSPVTLRGSPCASEHVGSVLDWRSHDAPLMRPATAVRGDRPCTKIT